MGTTSERRTIVAAAALLLVVLTADGLMLRRCGGGGIEVDLSAPWRVDQRRIAPFWVGLLGVLSASGWSQWQTS